MSNQTSNDNQPGCAEYAVIIALVALVAVPILIGRWVGLISEEQLNDWQKRFGMKAEDEPNSRINQRTNKRGD